MTAMLKKIIKTRRRWWCAHGSVKEVLKNFRVYPSFISPYARYRDEEKKSLMSFGTRASHGDRLPSRKHECVRKRGTKFIGKRREKLENEKIEIFIAFVLDFFT